MVERRGPKRMPSSREQELERIAATFGLPAYEQRRAYDLLLMLPGAELPVIDILTVAAARSLQQRYLQKLYDAIDRLELLEMPPQLRGEHYLTREMLEIFYDELGIKEEKDA